MKYCCEYIYYCPDRDIDLCLEHDRVESCCDKELEHECLADMYGSEDGLMFGDGFVCLRCGNYELVGLAHGPATEPGFPRKSGAGRTGWFDLPDDDS